MKKTHITGIIAGLMFLGMPLQAMATSLFTPVYLDPPDTTTEYVRPGNDPAVEDLRILFERVGVTNLDGSPVAINDPQQQLQYELFHAEQNGTIEIEYLGLQSTAAKNSFGYFFYDPEAPPIDINFNELFKQDETASRSTFTFDVTENSYFGFYLENRTQGKYVTTINDLSADHRDHVVMYETNMGYTLAFEDKATGFGGYPVDWDYEDLVVTVNDANPVPEPASCLLFGSGLIGLIRLARKNNQKS